MSLVASKGKGKERSPPKLPKRCLDPGGIKGKHYNVRKVVKSEGGGKDFPPGAS